VFANVVDLIVEAVHGRPLVMHVPHDRWARRRRQHMRRADPVIRRCAFDKRFGRIVAGVLANDNALASRISIDTVFAGPFNE
jgi:hypothetical protein